MGTIGLITGAIEVCFSSSCGVGCSAANSNSGNRDPSCRGGLPVNKFVRFFLSGRACAKSLLAHSGSRITTSLRVVGLLLAIALSCGSSWAQKDTGVIAGTVKDASGGAVAGAQVRVHDVDRGSEFD